MRVDEFDLLLSPLLSTTLAPPQRERPPVSPSALLVGMQVRDGVIELAVAVEGEVKSVKTSIGAILSGEFVADRVSALLSGAGLSPPKGRDGAKRVTLIVTDVVGSLAGIKAQFDASKPPLAKFNADLAGEFWRFEVLDLGRFVSAKGESTAVDILQKFLAFRQYTLKWDVDPLLTKSIAAISASIFRYKFLRSGPAPWDFVKTTASRSTKGGWRLEERRVPCFSGDTFVRKAAIRAYSGGRAEAFRRGLILGGPFVERDVISLYPSAALLQPLPNKKTKWTPVLELSELDEMEGFGLFAFKFPPTCEYPSLPVRFKSNEGLCFPLSGESHCSFAEVRAAVNLGAKVRPIEAYGFVPGQDERDHDVARFMKAFMQEKAGQQKGSIGYETAKKLLNTLVGKFAQKGEYSSLLSLDQEGRRAGIDGLGKLISSSPKLRGAAKMPLKVGSYWAPEWAALILGKSRALMAELVAKGAILVSTDAVVVPAGLSMDGPSLDDLSKVESGLPVQHTFDAIFVARARLYAFLKRPENLLPGERVLAQDSTWAVTRVARHGTTESEEQFARTVLTCLAAREDRAEVHPRIRRASPEAAARQGVPVNHPIEARQKTTFRWDGKRALQDRDANVFSQETSARPYGSVRILEAAGRRAAKPG